MSGCFYRWPLRCDMAGGHCSRRMRINGCRSLQALPETLGKLSCILSIDRCESLHEIPPQIRWMVTDEGEFGLTFNREFGLSLAALKAAYGDLLR